jgi:cytochrome c
MTDGLWLVKRREKAHSGDASGDKAMKRCVMIRHKSNSRSAGRTIVLFAFASAAILIVLSSHSSRASDAEAGDPVKGKLLFEKRCTGCHGLDHDLEGPRLRGVYGRKVGSVSNYKYSDALRNANVTWDDTTLDKWLTDPDAFIPDNDMEFHVAKPDERAGIIAYLRQSSGR